MKHSSAVLLVSGATLALAVFVQPDVASAGDCSANPAPGVNWQDCRKRNLILEGSDFTSANLSDADFSSSDLRQTKLEKTDLSKAALARAMFDSSSAQGANFEKALGYRTSFKNTQLAGARFSKAEMQRADFSGAVLTDADFASSELGRADFSDADINGTTFRFANLARADLRGAKFSTPIDFTGAYFYLTRIDGVDLSGTQGLEQWQIDLSCGDGSTKLPEGLEPSTQWPCGEEE